MSRFAFTALNDATQVELVQVDAAPSQGFPGIHVIGNASDVCKDGRERVRAALEVCNVIIPMQRFIISLSPADSRKEGNHFDLAIAIALVQLLRDKEFVIDPGEWLFASELGLDGSLKPCRGVISMALTAIRKGLRGIIVSSANLRELSILTKFSHPSFKSLRILGFDYLKDLLEWLSTGQTEAIFGPVETIYSEDIQVDSPALNAHNFSDMILNEELEDAAVSIAAGHHSALLRGSPGSGKTMFAERIPSIMPKLNEEDHLHLLQILSATHSQIPKSALEGTPPFRNPHHHSSAAAILGNADHPGELSLAHGGVIFLDELAEFRRDVLEGLREPLESNMIYISRSKIKRSWPANALLLGASNNCPCGWLGSKKRVCKCGTGQITAYLHKLSGPILDRIDIHINMPEETSLSKTWNIDEQEIREKRWLKMKQRVEDCVAFRNERLKTQSVKGDKLSQYSEIFKKAETIIPPSASRRSAVRCCKVARTLADMQQSIDINEEHISRAWHWQAESAAKGRGDHHFLGR